jgi:hypothetical protein
MRLGATYGAQWDRSLGETPLSDIKAMWAHELSVFGHSLHRIAWALENLPPRCPNVIEFKNICRQAPAPEVERLPEPKADPARLQAELSKLGEIRAQVTKTDRVDHKAWARRILARVQAGEKVRPITLRFAKEALQ